MCRELYAPLIYSPSGLHPGNPGESDFHSDVQVCTPTVGEGGSSPSFLTSCQRLLPLVLVTAILTKGRWNGKAILIRISLIAKHIEGCFKKKILLAIFLHTSPPLPPSSSLRSPEIFKTGSSYTSTDGSRTKYVTRAGLELVTLGFIFNPFHLPLPSRTQKLPEKPREWPICLSSKSDSVLSLWVYACLG